MSLQDGTNKSVQSISEVPSPSSLTLVGVQTHLPSWTAVLFDYIVFGSEGASALGKENPSLPGQAGSAANGSRGTREGGVEVPHFSQGSPHA